MRTINQKMMDYFKSMSEVYSQKTKEELQIELKSLKPENTASMEKIAVIENVMAGYPPIYKPIRFHDLRDITDDHLVYTALLLPESELELVETFQGMTEFFREINLIGLKDHVINLQYITGNVREEDGDFRSDVLITFNPEVRINPIGRLTVGAEVKWPSDFVTNFRGDYK